MHILVIGGSGFIGGNFIRYMLDNGATRVVNIDALSYAGKTPDPKHPRYSFYGMSMADDVLLDILYEEEPDYIVNFAAQTHVDRSIQNMMPFITTNIIETYKMLETLRRYTRPYKLVHISTDEVYGQLSVDAAPFTEQHPYAPNNPYAASKASTDHIIRAFQHTYGIPATIVHSSNNYGPFQHPEKFIPRAITSALTNVPIELYGTGTNIRDWMFVEDTCAGIYAVMTKGVVGEHYNLGSNTELTNNNVAQHILAYLNKPADMVRYVDDRLGHDFRYAIDCSKVTTQLGWEAKVSFADGLSRTIEWYQRNTEWIQTCRPYAYGTIEWYRDTYENG